MFALSFRKPLLKFFEALLVVVEAGFLFEIDTE